jgi:serine/threonine-protein kinase
MAGRREEALHCLDELHATARTRYVPSTCFAIVHIGLGELDRSLDWLELACDQRELPVTMVKVHPVYDPLRSQARFKNILVRLGLTVSNAPHYV